MPTMSVDDNLTKGFALLNAGNRKEAASEFFQAYRKAADLDSRIQIIDGLLNALDSVRDNETLTALSAEAIAIAERLQDDEYRAHFMARRAEHLMAKNGFLQYEQQMIKLAPGWVGFSLQRDKERYESLVSTRQANDQEIDDLLSRAVHLAEEKGREQLLGYVLMARGNVKSARYMERKGEYLRMESRLIKWFKSEWFRYYVLNHRFIFSSKHRAELKILISSYTADLLRAAKLFEEMESPMAGNAYFNLANHIRMTFRFTEANKYLLRAEKIANKYNDIVVIRQSAILRKVIKAKNKDIPNYLAGETRRLD
jgi:hypothetical protein